MHCSSYIAASMDGFIASADGGLAWLEAAQASVPAGEDCGYGAYMSQIDALVMGRHTYEKVLSFGVWPYDKPVYVLSRSIEQLPEGAPPGVLLCGSLDAVAQAAVDAGHARLYIDGGVTVQAFIAAGLLNEITVTRIPVLLGSGRPLFGPLGAAAAPLLLRHVQTRSWPFGFVQSHYALHY